MDPLLALALVAALVAVATIVGLVWRGTQGRVRRTTGSARLDGVVLASGATFVQFSSEFCAPCRATARVLDELVGSRDGLGHVELDVAERPELAARFGILQTPTTLVVDGRGTVRARIGGAVRRELLTAELDRVLGAPVAA
ncbi:thioredoxin family protein [Protaetiibacter mangrovi]|uniref:Thioredoxin family protein n=1 Tax=Protaetiibacter mangrovi TaxID=2970926 RepID=A0ABT1ZF14_9MICO|nr:thioredoxin family protein [Protaetiibacter mangrovi]MCS0499305.1 thioredoxin family protein [Protaetiibacter mangrovi]TPX05150.1 thioredoxin family protein [Schumannella luteola]